MSFSGVLAHGLKLICAPSLMLTQLPTPHLRCWAALEGTAAEDLDRQSLLSQIVGQPEARYEWMVEDVKVPSKWLAQPVMHRNAFDTWVVSALQGVAPLRTHGLLLAHKNHVYMVGGLPTAALLQHMTTLGPVSPPSLPYLRFEQVLMKWNGGGWFPCDSPREHGHWADNLWGHSGWADLNF